MFNQTEISQNISDMCNLSTEIGCMNISLLNGNITGRMKYIYFAIHLMVTLEVITGIVAITLNAVFLCAVSKMKKIDKPHHRFIKTLSVSDLFGAISFMCIINFPQVRKPQRLIFLQKSRNQKSP